MKQIIQDLKEGQTYLEEVPAPMCQPGCILIKNSFSAVSPGTERMLVDFGKASYLNKAKQQPDKVKQVFNKVKSDGIRPTIHAVRRKLNQPIALGYSSCGVVVEVGEGVHSFSVGDRVISNGCHAEYVCVPENLAAVIPDDVDDREAAFAVIAAIALQGIRLVKPSFGETIVVMGLGLIGQIAIQLLRANGCQVIGFDINEDRIRIAKSLGVTAFHSSEAQTIIMDLTDQHGADGVLIAASSKSDRIIAESAKISRKRGRIVLLGVIGLDIRRADFYEKELTFQVSCSYGPGRYEADYEMKGMDYPIGFVRWTEQRNFKAVLSAMASGQLHLAPLISKEVELKDYARIYDQLSDGLSMASLLRYHQDDQVYKTSLQIDRRSFGSGSGVIAIIGAGNFTDAVICPMLKKLKADIKYITSADGLSAARLAKKYKIAQASTDFNQVLADDQVDALIIATRHHLHAQQVAAGLQADKHVFVEKPLAITSSELNEIKETYQKSSKSLTVGYNRRFAPAVKAAQSVLSDQPMNVVITVNAGHVDKSHWTQDRDFGGGRIIGELCHFLDLVISLTGSLIKKVVANGLHDDDHLMNDNVSTLLKCHNGSQASIQYFSNGHKSHPKERIEIHQGGKTIVIDNFRRIDFYGVAKRSKKFAQDKGHYHELQAFVEMIKNGSDPIIPFDEIINSTAATLAISQSLIDNNWVDLD